MLFIHQQIQSFLNLGGCKEYSIMAKPRLPKKTSTPTNTTTPINTAKEANSTNSPLSSSQPMAAPPDALAASTLIESRKTEPRRTARKPEIVRTEPRANLVPINLEDEIRRLAYLLSERRGFEPGHESEDWLAAEYEIRQRYHQHSA
jgi:hypothetical protein